MKIKFIEPKTLVETETTLLEILKWEDDNRETIFYEKDWFRVTIKFYNTCKDVYVYYKERTEFEESKVYNTIKLTPEQVNELVETFLTDLL